MANIDFIADTQQPSKNIDFIPDENQSSSSSPYAYGNTFLSNLENSPLVNGVLGAGDALRNTMAAGANLLPGVNIPSVQTGDGLAYKLGNVAGNIGAFVGGGELLDGARLGATGIPMVGKLASALSDTGAASGPSSWLPGVARRALGTAAYSGITDQNNRAIGAGEGIGESLAADALPFGLGMAAKGSQYFMPGQYVKSILQSLGSGQSLEDATKSVIGSVKNAYDNQLGVSNVNYSPVLNSVRDRNIYNPVKDPSVFGTPVKEGQYQNISPSVLSNYDSDLSDLHNQFIQNPTFGNAHQLQSQLATNIRSLKGGNIAPDIATQNAISYLQKARGALQNDMSSFLNQESPHLSEMYSNAANNFYQNAAPYRANPKIYGMATGDITNLQPSTLGNVFKAPDENLNKIIGDLPPETINNLLYTKMGQRVPKMNPDAFMRNYDALDQSGLNSYITPQLQDQISSLKQRMAAKNALQFGTSAALGAALSGGHGGLAGTVGMGSLGAAVGRPIMNYIQNRLPLDQWAQSIGNVARGTYPFARTAVLANTLNGANQ